MGSIRFIYDEEDLKELKILCIKKEEKDTWKETLETIKLFCLDTIPENLEHNIAVLDDPSEYGFLISCGDNGEKILTHIFKNTYLVTRAAAIFKDEFMNEEIDINSLDFGKLKSDIEKVVNMDYHELAKLIGVIDNV